MNNVILVEDRIFRQKNLLGERASDLENFSLLKNVSGGDDFTEIKKQILAKNYSVFDDYSTILVHRSAFETEQRNGLTEYIKDYTKRLVLFSGGISGSHLSKLKKSDLMLMNVNEFYSENLFIFLESNAENLLQLAFGNNWQKSILIDAIEKLTLYEKTFLKDTPFSRIEDDLKLKTIIIEKYFNDAKINEIKVSKSEIGIVLKKMNEELKEFL
jgi:hypothetical protein